MKTIAHEFLDIEAEDFEVPQSCYDTLEIIIEKAKKRINVEAKPKKILSSIGKLLKKEGFSHQNKILLSYGLQVRKTNCKVSSLLYSAIAETLQLPISIIHLPEHMTVRWNDGKNALNWETTVRKKLDDKWYISSFKIAEEAISKGVYLRNLTRDEIKAIAFDYNGLTKSEEREKFDEAILDHTKAVELYPNFADAYYNRGNAKLWLKDFEGAILDYDKAIELDPNLAHAYTNRGLARIEKGCLEEALADYDKAIKLDPSAASTYNNRAIAKYEEGCLEEAIADFDKAIKLNPKNANAYYNRGIVKEQKNDLRGAKKDFKKYEKLKKKKSLEVKNEAPF